MGKRVGVFWPPGSGWRWTTGQAWATMDGDSVITLGVFGEDDGAVLLGTYTLEGLSL